MMKFFMLLFFSCVQIFAFNAEYKSFSSDFTQNIRSINSNIIYKGKFVLTQNEAFWSYEKPNNKQIFINAKEVVILEPDLEQVTYSSLKDIPNLSQIFKKAKQISSTQYQAKYQQTTYDIRLENDEIKSIAYKDDLDNEVLIILHNQKRDIPIDKSLFKPKIPAHYDILR